MWGICRWCSRVVLNKAPWPPTTLPPSRYHSMVAKPTSTLQPPTGPGSMATGCTSTAVPSAIPRAASDEQPVARCQLTRHHCQLEEVGPLMARKQSEKLADGFLRGTNFLVAL